MSGRLPNFVILGAAKAGTSSLHHYLGQHPQVFMSPVKEPKFFAYEGEALRFGGPGDLAKNEKVTTTLAEYRELFAGAGAARAVGESSPVYLYSEKACVRLRRHLPKARLFIVLRDPVERAYSSFLHLRRDGREPLRDFAAALREEPRRSAENYAPLWHYVGMGLYHDQVRRYFETFGRDRVHVWLYEELLADPAAVLRRMFTLLEVDPEFRPDLSRRRNTTLVPKSHRLHALLTGGGPVPRLLGKRLTRLLRERNLEKPPFPESARPVLAAAFRDDLLRLQNLLGRDLSRWLAG